MADIERTGRAPEKTNIVVTETEREARVAPPARAPVATNAELIREAVDEARELIKVEVALAKDEAKKELRLAAVIAGSGAVAAAAGLGAVILLLVSLGLAISISWLPVFVIGLIMLAIAIVAAIIAIEEIPKKPMKRTTRRVLTDARVVRQHV